MMSSIHTDAAMLGGLPILNGRAFALIGILLLLLRKFRFDIVSPCEAALILDPVRDPCKTFAPRGTVPAFDIARILLESRLCFAMTSADDVRFIGEEID